MGKPGSWAPRPWEQRENSETLRGGPQERGKTATDRCPASCCSRSHRSDVCTGCLAGKAVTMTWKVPHWPWRWSGGSVPVCRGCRSHQVVGGRTLQDSLWDLEIFLFVLLAEGGRRMNDVLIVRGFWFFLFSFYLMSNLLSSWSSLNTC